MKKKKIINTPIRSKIINPYMSEITNKLMNSFKSTSIYDLHKNFVKVQTYVNKEKKIDFTI